MKKVIVSLLSLVFMAAIATTGMCAELVAAWSFDNDTVESIADVSGNGFDGVGMDLTIVDGKFGNAMEFDGVNSQVEIPHDEALNIQDAITMEAWIKPSAEVGLGGIVQKWGDTTNRRQYLLCTVNDKIRTYISGSGDTWPSVECTSSIPLNEWTHVAGVYDSSNIKIYINGGFEGETANDEGLFASDIPVWIGGYGPNEDFGSNRHFPGAIDEVRLWAGALTEAEINSAMNDPASVVSAVDAGGKLGITWGSIK
jgi:hypothetical protein